MSTENETAEVLARLRKAALTIKAQSSMAQGFYDHHVYSQAHLRKLYALGDMVLSEIDFVQLAYQEGR